MWGWIKKWFDPITTSKIFILSQNQVLPTLTQFIDIESIPKKYGGQLDFECGDTPVLDPAIRACLTIEPGSEAEKYFLTAPVRWVGEDAAEDIGDPEGEVTALGVGSLNGKERREHLATLHSRLVRVATASAAVTPMPTEDRPPFSTFAVPALPNGDLAAATAKLTVAQNGVPLQAHEKKITLPPPPTQMERTKTEYLTPASDPEDIPKITAAAGL